jgi:hypothetical protein
VELDRINPRVLPPEYAKHFPLVETADGKWYSYAEYSCKPVMYKAPFSGKYYPSPDKRGFIQSEPECGAPPYRDKYGNCFWVMRIVDLMASSPESEEYWKKHNQFWQLQLHDADDTYVELYFPTRNQALQQWYKFENLIPLTYEAIKEQEDIHRRKFKC